MTKAKRSGWPMGPVSSGTMRPEDLIPAFLDELAYQLKHGPSLTREQRKDAYAVLNDRRGAEFWDDADAVDETLERLFEVLDYFAGPGFYFGAHPGDGADYGYWLSESFCDDFDGLRVSDTSEVPVGYRGEVLHVNDHGNVTLYVANGRGLREVWSVV